MWRVARVPPRAGLAKVLGIILVAGVGMPIGREGPLVHIAGIVA